MQTDVPLDQAVEAARLEYLAAMVDAAQARHAFKTANGCKIGNLAYEQLETAHAAATDSFNKSARRLQELLLSFGPLTITDWVLSQYIPITFAFQHACELLQQPEVVFADTYMATQVPIYLTNPPGRKMAGIINYDYTRSRYQEWKQSVVFHLSESEKAHEVLISEMLRAESKESSIEYELSENGWQDEDHYDWFVDEWKKARISFRATLAQLIEWRNGSK